MLLALDGLVALVVVALAWRSLNDDDLFRGVIQFIALGLLIAVAWVRLRAPDVALAEAAVGSGLTGALILSALVRMRRSARRPEDGGGASGVLPRVFFGILGLALFVGLSWAVLSPSAKRAGLSEVSMAMLPRSGVKNPVTAVLLNYRGYDTLLEVSVLLLAIAGVWSLRRGEWPTTDLRERPLLLPLLRLLLPLLALAAGSLLWLGAFAPGGAFQGGALLGGALVLAILGGLARRVLIRERLVRVLLVLGVLVFAGVGAGTLLLTGGLLEYPCDTGGTWILIIESAAFISIGLTLGLLYLGGRPTEGAPETADGGGFDHA